MKTLKNTSGLTLLELMIAVAILAIGLLAMVTVIVNSLHLEHQSKELNTAKNAAEFQLQRLRGMSYLDLLNMVDAPPPGAPNFIQSDGTTAEGHFEVVGLRLSVDPLNNNQPDSDGFVGRFTVSKTVQYKDDLNETVLDNNLVDLTVFIEWRGQRGGNQTFEITSMRSDRGERWQQPDP
jgi:prepilin-type N-terminal cleavage/methylation domain-containing protein